MTVELHRAISSHQNNIVITRVPAVMPRPNVPNLITRTSINKVATRSTRVPLRWTRRPTFEVISFFKIQRVTDAIDNKFFTNEFFKLPLPLGFPPGQQVMSVYFVRVKLSFLSVASNVNW